MAKFKECAKVVSQERIGTGIFSLWLQTEQVAGEAKPGQFINLYCQDGSRLLPRPISICEVNKEERQLRIVYRVAGKGTAEFSSYSKGDEVEILGPLGNGFPLDRMEEGKKAFLIGGGIGIALSSFLTPRYSFALIMIVAIVISAIPMAYSYFEFKREQKDKDGE